MKRKQLKSEERKGITKVDFYVRRMRRKCSNLSRNSEIVYSSDGAERRRWNETENLNEKSINVYTFTDIRLPMPDKSCVRSCARQRLLDR